MNRKYNMQDIKDVKELNRNIDLLDDLKRKHPNPTETQKKASSDIELKVAAFKFFQDIKETCSTCGAHKKRDGTFLVHTGVALSEKMMCVRVCNTALSRDKPCINPCTSVTPEEQDTLGFEFLSKDKLNLMINNLK